LFLKLVQFKGKNINTVDNIRLRNVQPTYNTRQASDVDLMGTMSLRRLPLCKATNTVLAPTKCTVVDIGIIMLATRPITRQDSK
jgi:hypothetical protein